MASSLGRADTVSLDTVRVIGVLAAVVVVKFSVTPVKASDTALLERVNSTPLSLKTAFCAAWYWVFVTGAVTELLSKLNAPVVPVVLDFRDNTY